MTVTRRAGWLACTAVLAGCVAATPAPVSTPNAAPAAAVAPGQTANLPWSADRPLTWNDFRGQPPADGLEGARTVYLLSYESRCRGLDFQFTVAALMLPDASWVKPRVLSSPNESARVLGHEQTHFDLTEVYARRMRRYFAELYNPCGLPEEELKASVDRFVREETEAQQRYDVETGYGLRPERQRAWDAEVADLVEGLRAFTGR